MVVVEELVRVVALAAAGAGFLLTTRRRLRIDPAFVPVLVLSGLGLTLFAAGLGRVLVPTTWALLLAGLALLAVELVRHPAAALEAVRDPTLVVLGGATAVLALFLRGLEFAHYDNFSHWALVVRVMLERGGFPTAADHVVVFQSYPLGSASLVYGAAEVVGGSEAVMMLAQAVLTLAAILGIAAFSRHRWAASLLAVLAYVAAIAFANPVTTLLVDGLVGTLAAASALLVIRHRDRMRDALLPAAVLTSFLAVVKSSGLLFVPAVPLLALVLARPPRRALGWRFVVLLLAPWLTLLAWTVHVRLTFPAGMQTEHSLSVSRLVAAFEEKTPEERRAIIDAFASRIGGETALWLLLAVALLGLALLWGQHAVTGRVAVAAAVGVVAVPAVFQLSTLGMYVSSMPVDQALALAGFRRYLATVEILLLVLTLALLLAVGDRMRHPVPAIAVGGLLAAMLIWPFGAPELLVRPTASESVRAAADRAVAGGGGAAGLTCVVVDAPDYGYRKQIVRYLLLSPDVQERLITPATKRNALASCDDVILLAPNDRAVEMLHELGHDLPHPPPVRVRL